MTDQQLTIPQVLELVRKQDMAMMATLDGRDLVARPMQLQTCDDDGTMWFFAATDSDKCAQLAADNRILVTFASGDFLSVSGTAEVVHDAAKNKELWDPSVSAWMQCEPEDPKASLIKVTPSSIGYWDSPSAVGAMLSMVKGLITKQEPKGGDSGVVELTHDH